ncbi:MAG: DUF922 domain-containing protein [Pseudomonadota bacterium]
MKDIASRLMTGLVVVGLAACVSDTPTEVSVRTYSVTGTTLNALERSLAAHGPRVPGLQGRAFAAVETSFLHSFEAKKQGTACRYNRDGRVALRSEVILPEWRQRDRAAPDVREIWDIYSDYAVIHENGHIKISQKYAKILEQTYRRLSAPDCEALEASLLSEADQIFGRHSAEQRLFDETDLPRFQRYLRSRGFAFGT